MIGLIDHKQLKKEYRAGSSLRVLAKKYGVSRTTIYNILRMVDTKFKKCNYYNKRKFSIKKIKSLYFTQGLSAMDCAEIIGCHESTITRYIRENGLKSKPYGHQNKISKDKVKQIIDMYNRSYRRKEIASACKVSVITVRKYINEYLKENTDK